MGRRRRALSRREKSALLALLFVAVVAIVQAAAFVISKVIIPGLVRVFDEGVLPAARWVHRKNRYLLPSALAVLVVSVPMVGLLQQRAARQDAFERRQAELALLPVLEQRVMEDIATESWDMASERLSLMRRIDPTNGAVLALARVVDPALSSLRVQRAERVRGEIVESAIAAAKGLRVNGADCYDTARLRMLRDDLGKALSTDPYSEGVRAALAALDACEREIARMEVAAERSSRAPFVQPSSDGCGSRGGPGWRRANGRCASWRD